MRRPKASERKLAVIDAETDPFVHGRKPKVFAWGFFDGETYRDFWGDDATQQLVDYLESREPLLIYAHNGGKFDFFYLLEMGLISDPLKIINGRLVKSGLGKHELRDSFAILPIPLAAYKKEIVDYETFERDRREAHKADILHYLATDCENLFELVDAFVKRFGTQLTVGATAIGKIRELHPFDRTKENHDDRFRPYYYGGRVECFERGILEGPFRVYDVNSMYPFVMRDYLHPTGENYLYIENAEIDQWGNCEHFGGRPYFAIVTGESDSALPVRTKDGLTFPKGEGVFMACSHEIRAALKLGLLTIRHANAWVPRSTIRFDTFVDKYSAEKVAAKKAGDDAGYLFAKFLQNSGYGKMGQNPKNYKEYTVVHAAKRKKMKGDWSLFADFGSWEIWQKPAPSPIYYDVAIGASITSAARSVLLEALHHSDRPVYCDTDSIICRTFQANIDDSMLGAWKFEAEGDRIAIAGKKLYALMNGDECVKLASKGARIEADDIFELCKGKTILWKSQAPNFKLTGETKFIQRRIRQTEPSTATVSPVVQSVIAWEQ